MAIKATTATTTKRKNPADLTGRNLRAAKKYNFTQDLLFQRLVRKVKQLEEFLLTLNQVAVRQEMSLHTLAMAVAKLIKDKKRR